MNTRCVRCGRTLKNPEAIKKGIGPVCEKKMIGQTRTEIGINQKSFTGPHWQAVNKIIMKRDQDGNAMTNVEHLHVHHSPTGFEWGYGGSGPAELARNICLQMFGNDEGYQEFKEKYIATIQREGGEIPCNDIRTWRADWSARYQEIVVD